MKYKSTKISVIAIFIICTLLVSGFQAPLPPPVKQVLHEVKVLEIDKPEEVEKIWELLSKPGSIDLIVLDLKKRFISSAQVGLIKEWVRSGHGLLLLDPAAHPELMRSFGFTVSFYDSSVHYRSEERARLLCTSTKKHVLLTDVDELGFFYSSSLQKWDSEYYKDMAFFDSGYDVPLFILEVDKKHFHETIPEEKIQTVTALKYLGSGIIVASAPWTAMYDAQRFYANLKELSAGYPVPPSVISGMISTEPTKKYDQIILTNQDIITGKILNESFTVKTAYGTFTFKRTEISRINLGENVDKIVLKIGDQLTGVLQGKEIHIKLVSGNEEIIHVDKVSRINFSSSGS